MANEEHLKKLRQGVEVWNKWRKDNPDILPDLYRALLNEADLNRADLYRAFLNEADLGGAKLTGADLTGADISGAFLTEADLSGAKLTGANLRKANLFTAYLRWADLRGADLSGADFSRAFLTEARFSNALIFYTNFANVDLSDVVGLNEIEHRGPSTVGIDTIYKSKGKIPEVFLRGAGVPEEFIEYMHSLVTGKVIQFYSCFISYSTRNQDFADRLHADLQSKGVRCWFAPEDIRGGRKLNEQIPEAIRLYDRLLLVLSEYSMQSEWVKTEIYHARQDEVRNNKRKLFPIGLVDFGTIKKWEAFDADIGKDMAREIREYFIPDFSNWKDHDSYKKALNRLLRDLEIGE